MNWRLKTLCTFYLFLSMFVNSMRTENIRKENSSFISESFNNSKKLRVNDTFRKDDIKISHKTKDEKQEACTYNCGKPADNNDEIVQNIAHFKGTKSSKNSTLSDNVVYERGINVTGTKRSARKLDKYHWKKDIITGRGKDMQMLLPLVIGFKLAGVISSGFTAIKIFLIQSMFVAKLAVIASAILLLKSYYDFSKHKPIMHKAAMSFSPYYEYEVPYHSTGYHDASGYQFGYDNGQWQGVEGVAGDTDIGTSKEDHDTQYSDPQPVVAEIGINNTSPNYSNYYSQRDYTASERLSNSSVREKYKPLIIGYETYIKRITTKKLDD